MSGRLGLRCCIPTRGERDAGHDRMPIDEMSAEAVARQRGRAIAADAELESRKLVGGARWRDEPGIQRAARQRHRRERHAGRIGDRRPLGLGRAALHGPRALPGLPLRHRAAGRSHAARRHLRDRRAGADRQDRRRDLRCRSARTSPPRASTTPFGRHFTDAARRIAARRLEGTGLAELGPLRFPSPRPERQAP